MKVIFDETYYNANEICDKLGISLETARRMFRNGRIKGKKIGREWHATEQAIREAINTDTQL